MAAVFGERGSIMVKGKEGSIRGDRHGDREDGSFKIFCVNK